MSLSPGQSLPLSLPRRLIADLMHFSRKVPIVPMERRMHLSPVQAARLTCPGRPSWCALFTKALALVAARRPELRRSYLSLPGPRLYQHPRNVAALAIERRVAGEDGVLFALLREPERRGLSELSTYLRGCKDCPVENNGSFRRALRISRWPWPLRRLAWWLTLNLSGRLRERCLGTFGVSVTAGLGATALYVLSPLTLTLNYGVFAADGSLDVRLSFDHRVLDGGTVARALQEVEEVLLTEIRAELGSCRAAA